MNRWTGRLLAMMLVCTAFEPLAAQADSGSGHSLFTWRDALLAGGFAVGTLAIRPFDKQAQEALQQPERQNNKVLRKAATGFRTIAAPGSVIIGLAMYAGGRFSNNDHLAELGLHGTEALFIGEGVGSALKDFLGRARPSVGPVANPDNWQLMRGFKNDDRYRSFPSGHSVAGFAAAAAVTAETSRWWPNTTYIIGPAMYGGAVLIGLSRMYENRHWASDVIMGAAIGTFAGIKVVRYYHEHPGNRLDKWLLNASVSPRDWTHVSFSVVPLVR